MSVTPPHLPAPFLCSIPSCPLSSSGLSTLTCIFLDVTLTLADLLFPWHLLLLELYASLLFLGSRLRQCAHVRNLAHVSDATAGLCGGTGKTCEECPQEEVDGSGECRLRRSVLFFLSPLHSAVTASACSFFAASKALS